jgi:type I restriction enzyme S subunit
MAGRHRHGAKVGWRQCALGDLCREDRRVVDPFSPRASELPYLGLEHIESGTGRITRDANAGTNGEGRSTTFAFDPRHVLYGKLRPYLNKVALPDFAGRCTTELIPLLPAERVQRDFLAWLLRRPTTVEAAMRHKTGARMPRADMRRVLALTVEIPEGLEEQRRIASRLSRLMLWATRAREACRRQEELIERIAWKMLSEFPHADGGDLAALPAQESL